MNKGISEELVANGFYFMLSVYCCSKQHNQSNTHCLGFFSITVLPCRHRLNERTEPHCIQCFLDKLQRDNENLKGIMKTKDEQKNRNEHSETKQEREERSRFSWCVNIEQVQNHITQSLFNVHCAHRVLSANYSPSLFPKFQPLTYNNMVTFNVPQEGWFS